MDPISYILLSVLLVSLISFMGILFIFLKKNSLDKFLMFLVSLSVGSLLGGAFLHLIPESFGNGGFSLKVSFLILTGILIFFIIENFIHWRHCHIPTSKDHPHHLGAMNMIGDGIHNLIDGLVIAAAYFVNVPLGIATTLAVIIHEIPQEIGDFGVLLYAGYSKKKALFFNFLSALMALVGAIIGILFSSNSQAFVSIIIPIAAGGFLYIASSDLIPEIHKNQEKGFSLKNLIGILLGILMMYLLTLIEIV
ncbi:MAG: ZIP family metal transporter [Nanoarchaeota archaeon]